MTYTSFNENKDYNENRIVIDVILETSFSKEIRILLKEGQIMKEHKAPYPIIVHVLEGEINFGIQGTTQLLTKGAILTLDGNIHHDLTALKDSEVRLSISKLDKLERVEKAADAINND